MADPVKLVTTTPLGNQIELTFKRWFQTKEFYVDTATTLLAVIPTALDMVGTIGLSNRMLLIWTIVLIIVRQVTQNFLRSQSNTIVLGKEDYHAVKEEQASAPVDPPQQ